MPLSASSSGMALFPRHVSKRPRFESTTVFTPNKRDIRVDVSFIWWGKVDSNHRRHCQQIYSLSHLATLEFPHIQLRWSWWTDSNPRPADYKSAALPAELHQRIRCDYITIPFARGKVKPQNTVFCGKTKRQPAHWSGGCRLFAFRPFSAVDVLLQIMGQLANGVDLLNVLIGDLDIELVLQGHH